jgi:hypothetical protein
MYSCDANEEAEEGKIEKGKVIVNLAKDRS